MIKEKLIESVDEDGNTVKVMVKRPTAEIYRDSQIAYNKAFREALESGAMLKDKLHDYYKVQKIWSDEKEKLYQQLLDDIQAHELIIKKGGIPLKEAKQKAVDLKILRVKFADLIAERQSHDANCAESQADNARFNHLIITCVLQENGKDRMWKELKDYDTDATQPWALEAAQELAQMLYGLDPDYEKSLVENKFLVKYKFADEKLRFLNKEGHLIDEEGRLLNDEGRYVAYRDDGTQYFVDKRGREVSEEGDLVVEFSPFLDDDGSPIADEEEASAKEEVTKVKRTRKKTTSEV